MIIRAPLGRNGDVWLCGGLDGGPHGFGRGGQAAETARCSIPQFLPGKEDDSQ